MSLARTSLIIFIMRFSNMGLMMVGPILLARLLPVYEFGVYREFLVYSGALQTISAFSLSNGLMYLVPSHPGMEWTLVRQTALLTGASTAIVCLIAAIVNAIAGGDLLGSYPLAVLVYALLYVNLDFWEHLWLSQKKPALAFYYTSGRLALRLLTVAVTAILTRDVTMIIGALIVLEMLRVLASAGAWFRWRDDPATRPPGALWRAQLRFCVPLGLSLLLTTVNSYLGSILISVTLGAALLAQYSIGTYAVPVLYMLRNSVSDALLPHMATQTAEARAETPSEAPQLDLWHRSNTLFAMMLLPVGVLLARFAELIVVVLFSEKYLPAVIVFQVYLLSILTHLVDFGVPFRLLEKTSIYLYSTVASIAVNLVLLALLLPSMGILGAIIATLGAEAVWMGIHTVVLARLTKSTVAEVIGLRDTLRVALCCAVPVPLLAFHIGRSWTDIPAAAAMSLAYTAVALLLMWFIGTVKMRELLEAARDRIMNRLARG